jgi:glyoxylase-like metal-dependent hydrolase (beta-lactamase superfamily II)
MATPGHTADSVSFYQEEERALLCGDLILHLKPEAPGILNPYHENGRTLRATWERLAAAVRPAMMYPGHGFPLRHDRSALSGVELPHER